MYAVCIISHMKAASCILLGVIDLSVGPSELPPGLHRNRCALGGKKMGRVGGTLLGAEAPGGSTAAGTGQGSGYAAQGRAQQAVHMCQWEGVQGIRVRALCKHGDLGQLGFGTLGRDRGALGPGRGGWGTR